MNSKAAIATLATHSTTAKFATALVGLVLLLATIPVLAQSGDFTFVSGSVTIERGAERIVPIRGTSVRPFSCQDLSVRHTSFSTQ